MSPFIPAFTGIALVTSLLACDGSSTSELDVCSTTGAALSEVSCPIGGGSCLVAVQNFYRGFGLSVGIAPGVAIQDAFGNNCAAEGACQLWVRDLPSSYGWQRTIAPTPYDIGVFPPNSGNPWGHIAIVHHADANGVWYIDSNDAFNDVPNNVPHLHTRPPYGFYHYPNPQAPLLACMPATPPPVNNPPPPAPTGQEPTPQPFSSHDPGVPGGNDAGRGKSHHPQSYGAPAPSTPCE